MYNTINIVPRRASHILLVLESHSQGKKMGQYVRPRKQHAVIVHGKLLSRPMKKNIP